MVDIPHHPPLKSLHPEGHLNAGKPAQIDRLSTEALLDSLLPGLKDCLKTRPEGTILDGHHRIHIIRQRGVDVDGLPRQIIVKDQ
jgi:hypothetical protein